MARQQIGRKRGVQFEHKFDATVVQLVGILNHRDEWRQTALSAVRHGIGAGHVQGSENWMAIPGVKQGSQEYSRTGYGTYGSAFRMIIFETVRPMQSRTV